MIKNIRKIMLLLILSILVLSSKQAAHAVLQSNGNTHATYKLNEWMLNIRKMETNGGALGLTEEIDTKTLLNTSESNDLDIHMQKNTEYGAMALLSASNYGNPNKVSSGGTTTGNKSGVYMYYNANSRDANEEFVAASVSEGTVYGYASSNLRYRNIYERDYVAKPGDAIIETNGWHGATSASWNMNNIGALLRGQYASIFTYYTTFERENNGAPRMTPRTSRAVVVNGEGI